MNIRELERASIRDFLKRHSDDLAGRVLDFGCGKQPYRDLVSGEYHAWDSPKFPGSVVDGGSPLPHWTPLPSWTDLQVHPARFRNSAKGFDTIISTQVIQYCKDPLLLLRDRVRLLLKPGGKLLMTGPTNWPIVEKEDLWRYTVPGITTLLDQAGFDVQLVFERASVDFQGERWPLGWAAVATVS